MQTLTAQLRKGKIHHRFQWLELGERVPRNRQNDLLRSVVEENPDQFFAFGSVHPEDGPEALAEFDRLKAHGFAGLKLHPNTQGLDLDSANVQATVERAAEHQLPILIDGYNPTDADQTGKILMLAVRNPTARIIIAHMGGPRFSETVVFGMLREFQWYPRNVWVDLSATVTTFAGSPYEEQLKWVVRQIGVDRALFGSDFPVSTPEVALAALRQMGFTADEERQLLYTNSAQLFLGHPN